MVQNILECFTVYLFGVIHAYLFMKRILSGHLEHSGLLSTSRYVECILNCYFSFGKLLIKLFVANCLLSFEGAITQEISPVAV